MPTPMRAPTRQCEVDTGNPIEVDTKTANVAPYPPKADVRIPYQERVKH